MVQVPLSSLVNSRHQSLTIAAALSLATVLRAAVAPPDFGWMSLEQLGQIKVVTASKHLQPAWTTPSALSVITPEDLRLSGVHSIPQALRLAPGADVAQINSQRYAVSIRGFANEYANKLLVLQDGRSLYTPQFLGVFWDAQDTSLEDIDRIEIVRGPGGTAWGINAMNGVVNILTKDARDTQGTALRAGGGTFERAFATVRHGGALTANTHFRVYAKAFARGETESAAGLGSRDDWNQQRLGFRVDSQWPGANHLTLQGDTYTGRLLQYTNRAPDWFRSAGANLLGRLNASLPGGSTLQVLSYFDAVRRRSAPATANSDSFVVEANHRLELLPRHTVSWGVDYQHIRNEALGRLGHNYDPAVRRLQRMSISASDEFAAVKDRLLLTVGAKAEYNDFTHWEILPSARLTWTPSEHQTGWLAVSRGLQTPDLSSYDLTIDIPGAVHVVSLPNRDRPAGQVVATEAGWRLEPRANLALDATVFHNRYDRLSSTASTFNPATSTFTAFPTNDQFGETHGFELAAVWEPAARWRIHTSYSLLRMHLHVRPASNDAATAAREQGASPREQWQIMSHAGLGPRWDFTTWLRYVGARHTLNIPAYVGLDVRLAFRPTPGTELALTGKDLLDAHHPEFTRSPGFPANLEIPRAVQFEFTWRR